MYHEGDGISAAQRKINAHMNITNKKILVTGGAGFIGSHFVETMAKKTHVTIYDNFASSVLSINDLNNLGNVKVIKDDILDQKKLENAMRGVDIVFHFAVACVRISLSNERHVHDVNATGTLSALLAAKKADVKRFIYISSSEAYGSAKQNKISETHPMDPTTVYGMSKYIGELYAKHFNDHQRLPTIVVRPFNTYGPRSHFEDVYGEVIPRFVIRALNGKQPMIFGTGRQTRDFTFVTDTVSGIIQAASYDKLLGDCVNIAYGKEVSIFDIAKIVCIETGLPFAPIMKPSRPKDVMKHYADTSKAKKLFSYKPKIEIRTGLREYITWVKKTYPNPKKLLKLVPDINW
jgi:UDP-glucose 4-epimerase